MRKKKSGEFDPILATWGTAFIVPAVLAILLYIGHSRMPRRIAPFLSKPIPLQFENLALDDRLGVELDNRIILVTIKEDLNKEGLDLILQKTRDALSLKAIDLVLLSSFDSGRTWPIQVLAQVRHAVADKLRVHESILAVGFNTVHRLASLKPKSGKVMQGEGECWGVSAIRAQEAWKLSKGKDCKIAFIDSGALQYHRALSGKINFPYSLATDSPAMQVGSFVTPTGGLEFVTSHGTHLSVLACGNDNQQIKSIAPEAELVPIQSLWYREEENEVLGGAADIVAAMRYAVAAKAKVICIGTEPCISPELASYYKESPRLLRKALRFVMRIPLSIGLESFRLAIDEANKAGVIIVKAAGNQNLPAWFDEICLSNRVITVGAVDKKLRRASFSNYGKEITVSAPGVEVKGGSANPDSPYGIMSGTSVAAAHVASVIALMKAKNPALTFEEVRHILVSTGKPIAPAKGEDEKTMGPLVDAKAAVDEVVKRLEKGTKAQAAEKPLLLREGRPVPLVLTSEQSAHLPHKSAVKSSQAHVGTKDEVASDQKNSTSDTTASATGQKDNASSSGGSGKNDMAPVLDPSKVYVTFKSSPSGAKVYCYQLPSRYVGKTPLTFGFAPGTYKFKYAYPGRSDEIFERTITLGQKPVFSFDLKVKSVLSETKAAEKPSISKPSKRRGQSGSGGLGSPEHAQKMAGTWVEVAKKGRYTLPNPTFRLMTLAFETKISETDISGTATSWSGPFHLQKSDKWIYEPGQSVLRLKPGNTENSFRGEYLLPHKGWTKVTVKIKGDWATVDNRRERVGFSIFRLPKGVKLKPLFARKDNQNGLANEWGNVATQIIDFRRLGNNYNGYAYMGLENKGRAKLAYKIKHAFGSTYKGTWEGVNVFKRVYPVTLTVKNNRLTRFNEQTKRSATYYRLAPWQ